MVGKKSREEKGIYIASKYFFPFFRNRFGNFLAKFCPELKILSMTVGFFQPPRIYISVAVVRDRHGYVPHIRDPKLVAGIKTATDEVFQPPRIRISVLVSFTFSLRLSY